MLALTPNQHFTWKVRAEFEGTPGPWSTSASFQSGDPAPSFVGPIGDWQHCGALVKDIALSQCVHDAVNPRIRWAIWKGGQTHRVAAAWRRQRALIKAAARTSSCGRVTTSPPLASASPMARSSRSFPMPARWHERRGSGDNGFVDLGSYVPAIDPSKP